MAKRAKKKTRGRPKPTYAKKKFSQKDLAAAAKAMLDKLQELSGGAIIFGCCTQGCCD
jgi:hypothetical protein